MPNGGTSPTNMFEELATLMRLNFYPKINPTLIDWFDVVPPDTYETFGNIRGLVINPVTLQQANGLYSVPSWNNLPEDGLGDWTTFIQNVLDRSQKVRDAARTIYQKKAPGA